MRKGGCPPIFKAYRERDAGDIVKKLTPVFIAFLSLAVCGGRLPAEEDSAKAVRQAGPAVYPLETTNPENAPHYGPEKKTDKAVSAHKTNYFSINRWPGGDKAQVKFQISMKFQLLKPDLYIFKRDLFPAYIAYTQKSLWNEGLPSRPFEESNYNPEFFLDYPVNALSVGRFKLRNIIACPLEHESNGLSEAGSRSWNRQYILLRFGLEAAEELETANSFPADKALFLVKLWRASGYSAQDAYLKSIGSRDKFLDYMGRGELGASVRNFLWGGSFKNHQLEIKTPVFCHKSKISYGLEFRQQFPGMNSMLYLQYWHGYGETLLRFERFGRRGFAGFSFSY